MYVYLQPEPGLFTVGIYDPQGVWIPESDHQTRDAAAERVHYLNGGRDDDHSSVLEELLARSQARIEQAGP